MFIDFLLHIFEKNKYKDAIIWKDQIYSYHWLLERITYWQNKIRNENIPSGKVTTLTADFSPNSIALFLALIEHACILVPLTNSVEAKKYEFINTAQSEFLFDIDEEDKVQIIKLPHSANNKFYNYLKRMNYPGLILFSSGSTGKNKAIVHDFLGIMEKFKVPRRSFRTITFLLYDHIGGINTMIYTLSNAGCIVSVQNRSPDIVLRAIDRHQVELLPTSPTFINLILLSEAYKRYNLTSLRTITYGTEPMPESTLKRLHNLFPKIQLLQTYGLSELGILRSKSKSSDSMWVKIGGEGFQTRIVNGILQIKAQSHMLGYLNAPSPFTQDGWFNTDDSVEVDGEYIRLLGRKSEIINVGGQKVYPAEVESVIQELDNVVEVTVYGENNPITGNIVCAKLRLIKHCDRKLFIIQLKKYCRKRLQNYKVPIKVKFVDEKQYNERFKKMRNYASA